EQLLPAIRRAGGEIAWTAIYVVHSGSDHSPEGRERKLERDLRILHQELAEQHEHPFVLFNLGMTYADAGNHSQRLPSEPGRSHGGGIADFHLPNREFRTHYDAAIHYMQRCIAVSKPEESHLRKAYALLAVSFVQADRHEEAFVACQTGLAFCPDDKELLFPPGILHDHFG